MKKRDVINTSLFTSCQPVDLTDWHYPLGPFFMSGGEGPAVQRPDQPKDVEIRLAALFSASAHSALSRKLEAFKARLATM